MIKNGGGSIPDLSRVGYGVSAVLPWLTATDAVIDKTYKINSKVRDIIKDQK